MVVVAIIAILAAILMPVFVRAKHAAKVTVCSSNIRGLAQAVTMYGVDYDEYFPLAAYATDSGYLLWHDLIDPYVVDKRIWQNPATDLNLRDATGALTCHFGYNASYLTDIAVDFSNAQGHRAVPESAVVEAAETLLLATARSSVAGSWCGDEGKFLLPPSLGAADCWGRPDLSQFKHAVIAWVDTHVSKDTLGEFYENQTPPDRFFDLQ